MLLPFTKMHGLGNDFIVVNNLNNDINLSTSTVRKLSDRRFGIGFDQLLVVESADDDSVEFNYRIYNYDGGEVEHCGNGARCFAKFVRDKGLTSSTEIAVNTSAGRIVLLVNADETVTVRMGVPEFEPSLIPFSADSVSSSYTLKLNDEVLQLAALAIGNPHAVIQVDNIDRANVEGIGPELESHSRFPNRVNVGFMEIVSKSAIRLRVFERGVGETKACGTGACAAVVSGIVQGLLQNKVKVSLPGGELGVEWNGPGETVLMTGPCETVFEGTIEI